MFTHDERMQELNGLLDRGRTVLAAWGIEVSWQSATDRGAAVDGVLMLDAGVRGTAPIRR